MEILDKIKSKTDNVTKYIILMDDDLITEFSYINKDDGKDIVCVPSQTLCAQGCKFCHVTDQAGKLELRNLSSEELIVGTNMVLNDLGFTNGGVRNCLLVSFMGCGEPLMNVGNILKFMRMYTWATVGWQTVRFAIATMIPKQRLDKFYYLCDQIRNSPDLKVKIHLSLHYTFDEERARWMPNAINIQQATDALKWAKEYCGISIEAHYALIAGVNDFNMDFRRLANIGIPVKFLRYNEKDTIEAKASAYLKFKIARMIFKETGVKCEYYIPPGTDVGSSCGQFLMDYYEKYNKVKIKEVA